MVKRAHLITHRFRGYSDCENSLEGFVAALDDDVRLLEFDIRVARCGTPLVYHDETAPDAMGTPHHIADTLAADILTLGGDFAHIPTADALFTAAAKHNSEAQLLVDVKEAGFEDIIIALAASHRLLDRITWVSWLPETLYAIHERLPDAKLIFSHWCQSPSPATRAKHIVYNAKSGHIPRPKRRLVHGERSGWFVDGPLRGELREMIHSVCVPAHMVSRALVEDYHRDEIEVSAFSYVTREGVETAAQAFGLDTFFIDAKRVFDSYA